MLVEMLKMDNLLKDKNKLNNSLQVNYNDVVYLYN
jgi:hypothetical protein